MDELTEESIKSLDSRIKQRKKDIEDLKEHQDYDRNQLSITIVEKEKIKNVLQNHLKGHMRIREDHDLDYFYKEIENELEKLEGEKSGDDSHVIVPHTNAGKIESKNSHSKSSRKDIVWTEEGAFKKDDENPFDLRKFIEFALENAKVDLPNKEQINEYVVVAKDDLKEISGRLEMMRQFLKANPQAHWTHIDDMIEKLEIFLKEKYLSEEE